MLHASAPSAAPPASHKGIVWLASYPRSGNTWLRFFIHCLLEVMQGVPDERINITGIGKYSQWEADPVNFLPFVKDPRARESFPQVAAVRPQVQQAMLDRENSSFFVKTHLVLAQVNGTPTINSNVTKAAVYVVRDPRDVACSLAAHLGWSLDTAIGIMAADDYVPANGAREAVSSWSRNVETWTNPARPSVKVVRYEDMLTDTVRTFRAIAAHVSINPTDDQLNRAIRLSSFDRLKKQQTEFNVRATRADGVHRQLLPAWDLRGLARPAFAGSGRDDRQRPSPADGALRLPRRKIRRVRPLRVLMPMRV